MPSARAFRVIEGGKGSGFDPDMLPQLDIDQLRERALQLRYLLALSAQERGAGLVDDMEEAIGALQRLLKSSHPLAPRRIAEYRTLVAEIDVEILAALEDG